MNTCRMPLDNGKPCNTTLYVCTSCGHRGCKNDKCRNQGFDRGFARCFACGATFGIRSA
jgi:hypothetical protein